MRKTAMSLAASEPTTTESSVVRLLPLPEGSFVRNVTKGFSMPDITWKLVTT